MERKLAAIFSADVQGYSRLMGDDEAATVRTLTAYREVMTTLIEQHRGRVVDSPGDNLLAEFASVVDAVQGAVAIQQELATQNDTLPDDRKMRFRIGINLGDVITEDERLYGDGVNIAARLEGLAEGGGICISGTAYDQVKNRLALGYTSLGEHTVKNIADPVRVYRVLTEPKTAASCVTGEPRVGPRWWRGAALVVMVILLVGAGATAIWHVFLRTVPPLIEVASQERMAFPLPDKPSIAVLPFDNLSGDPEQGYFADGITEDIITALYSVPNLFVIARNSTFTYKGKPVKVQQVSEELGVRYVLEGSVQKAGNRVRISAQLIDALTGHHLWAESYDRDMQDLFALQDEITREIVIALAVKLTAGEQFRVWNKHPRNVEAWSYLGQGVQHFHRFTPEDNGLARRFFAQAIDVDPEYAFAYAMLAWTHWLDAMHGWSESRAQSIGHTVELAHKARALDDTLPDVYALLGAIHLLNQEYDEAVAVGKKAVALNPNHANNTALLAMILLNTEQPHAAIRAFNKAMRLSPYYDDWYLEALGLAYLLAGEHEQALTAFGKFLERKPSLPHAAHAHLGRARAYDALGRERDARAAVAQALEVDPSISVTSFTNHSLRKDKAAAEQAMATLHRLGLPQ